MTQDLQAAGYRLDPTTGVWARPDHESLAYSDGDDVERRLASVIASVSDVSVLSDELRTCGTDWPSRYHLSAQRANVLRPFAETLAGASVLEVGAGCGAVTRYLGEVGARVLALEGSTRRAAIARSRTRGLDNVEVLAERFDRFTAPAGFDVVTLIGVLEYANLYESGPTPAATLLQRIAGLLKPGGLLLLAIENQLGLKYFLGAPEDHLGVPMYGVEDQYRDGQPRTYGRRALARLLEAAGFARQRFLSPLPDYKFPVSVVDEGALATDAVDAGALASQSASSDPQLPGVLVAAPELVWPAVAANGLALDLANSFLVAASTREVPHDGTLAWHFTTSRTAAFCKVSRFVVDSDGARVVRSVPMQPEAAPPAGPLRFHPAPRTPYVAGPTLAWEATRLLGRDGWTVDELATFFRRYLDLLPGLLPDAPGPATLTRADDLVPGQWFDLLPQNIVIDATTGAPRPIDLEWTFEEPLPVGYLVFRAVLALTHGITRVGLSDDERTATRRGVIEAVFDALHFDRSAPTLEAFMAIEARVQRQVAPGTTQRFTLDELAATELNRDSVFAVPARLSHGLGIGKSRILRLIRTIGQESAALRRHLESVAYLEQNPDVRAAGVSPLAHWLEQGYIEERVPTDDLVGLLEEMLAERERTGSVLAQSLSLIEPRLGALLAERDARIAELTQAIAALSAQLGDLSQALVSREEVTRTLHAVIAERDAQLAARDATVATLQHDLAEAATRATEAEVRLAAAQAQATTLDEQRTHHISELERAVWDRETALGRLSAETQSLHEQVAQLKHELTQVYGSTSWRVTSGLRGTRRVVSALLPPYRPGGQAFKGARWLYRSLPLPEALKRKGRSTWMRHLFRYETPASVGIPSPAAMRGEINAPANGRHEWETYAPFKAQLAAHAERRQAEVAPAPVRVLTVSDADTRRTARSLRFPTVDAPQVSIVIPVYGGTALVLECLSAILAAQGGLSYEVIVADDASPGDTADVLALVDGLRLRRNPENLGFLRNCNAAFADCRGTYTVILNSDVQVSDGWLDALVRVFERHPDAGAAGPRILYPSGHLQEAGVAFRPDATADMVGLNDDPSRPCYTYTRPVDYCSGAALLVRTDVLREIGGFDDRFAPAYCEDADLCLRLRSRGLKTYYTPDATVVHHLSKTMTAVAPEWKSQQIARNLATFTERWAETIDAISDVRVLAFYLPQFHAIPENDAWWGEGFTEWTNVRKAVPNFEGHYQPREPADLGYYDLNDPGVLERQAALARRYGIDGFVFYYYWFGGKRLLEMPLERLIRTGRPAFPHCVCWANENWSRRWDGREQEILIGQSHSPDDDRAVIRDISRHFASPHYIRIDGRPLVLVYRVELFPDFRETAARWREVCRADGHGEIYLAYVESHDLVHRGAHPSTFGCDASVEFPPLNMAERTTPAGPILNPEFEGAIGDYATTAMKYCTRELPDYPRFRGVTPGWDNTARRQHHSFAFEQPTPGIFQAWLETVITQTRAHRQGDERLVFVNAWNEWAEGAYLEPDRRFGHTYLEAVRNAKDAERLLRFGQYGLDL